MRGGRDGGGHDGGGRDGGERGRLASSQQTVRGNNNSNNSNHNPAVEGSRTSFSLMNFDDSAGSCFWISSAPKMFSRYIHARWHASHSSSISESSESFFSHSSTSVRMPPTKREAKMVCSATCESSSCKVTSSKPPRMKMSDWSRWLSVAKAISAHDLRIFSSSCSRPNSPDAVDETSEMNSAWLATP
jgi:hypothetical protein